MLDLGETKKALILQGLLDYIRQLETAIQRRGWDSNPRYAETYNGFRDRPIQPLSHLSVLQYNNISALFVFLCVVVLMGIGDAGQ